MSCHVFTIKFAKPEDDNDDGCHCFGVKGVRPSPLDVVGAAAKNAHYLHGATLRHLLGHFQQYVAVKYILSFATLSGTAKQQRCDFL